MKTEEQKTKELVDDMMCEYPRVEFTKQTLMVFVSSLRKGALAEGKRQGLIDAAELMEGSCRWRGNPYYVHSCGSCKNGRRIRGLIPGGMP